MPESSHSQCVRDRPYPVLSRRVAISAFRRKYATLKEAVKEVRETLTRYRAGESIGFTRVASLKSMGLIPRSNGGFELGRKYCRL